MTYHYRAAIAQKNWPVVIRFIKSGDIHVDTCTCGDSGNTALMSASSQNGTASVVISLIGLGADIDKTNNHGANALSLAAGYNMDGANVRILLNRGADLVPRCGRPAIIIASEYNNTHAVRAMLDYGVYYHTIDTSNPRARETPLDFACHEGNTDICRLLLDAGADPLIKNGNGKTPYDTAMYHGNIHIDKTGVRQLMTDAIEKHAAVPPTVA